MPPLGEPLFEAAKQGNMPQLRAILSSKGAPDVNSANESSAGSTALHYAAWNGMIASVEYLIGAGGDVNKADAYGRTPLHLAARQGHAALVEKMAKRGADVHARQQLGATPLHYAAIEGHTSTCQRLVKLGADITSETGAGATPLALAEKKDQYKAIAYLKYEVDKLNKSHVLNPSRTSNMK